MKFGKESKEDTNCNTNTHQRKEDPCAIPSSDNLSGLVETVHLLKSPANAAQSIEQYRKGQTREYGLVAD